ncbi:TPA: CaiF/GrlA family transcriptional regulator [Serratia marcescens]
MSRKLICKEVNANNLFPVSEKKRIAPRQSNHEEYTLPDCLVNYPAMPLYLAVAHFGLLTQQILSREVICQAFHIDTRRALEVMRYLVNGAPSVICECLSLIQRRGYCLRVLAITSVESATENAPLPSSRASARKRGSTLERERAQHQVRQWFLRRPNP